MESNTDILYRLATLEMKVIEMEELILELRYGKVQILPVGEEPELQ